MADNHRDADILADLWHAVSAANPGLTITGKGDHYSIQERPSLVWEVKEVSERKSLDATKVRLLSIQWAVNHDPRDSYLERLKVEDTINRAVADAIAADAALLRGPWLSGFGSFLFQSDRAYVAYAL